jgi:DNA polymerase-3 subunit alpha
MFKALAEDDLNIQTCNLNDPDVWDMICDGQVKGCFQIESYLGKSWVKKIKPRTISELSDVIALIRPGCLASSAGGKSMTQIYCDRKHGLEKPTSFHESIDHILQKTYGVIVYQEQSMKIAEVMAKFTLEQADDLRKAIGKKKADLMAKVRLSFIEGCVKNNITEEKAIEVFDIIEKSNRYSFNASHSVCYATLSYWSAYVKYHRPKKFFVNWLRLAADKVDPDVEVKELVMATKGKDLEVAGPHYTRLSDDFFWDSKYNCIRFGVCNIKYVGQAHHDDLKKFLDENPKPTWSQLLIEGLYNINKKAIENMISVGTFSGFGKTRSEMLHEFSCLNDLNDNEVEAIKLSYDKSKPIIDIIQSLVDKGVKKKRGEVGFISTAARLLKVKDIITRLNNPGRSLKDNPSVYAKIEEKLLGCSIYHSELTASAEAGHADTRCVEIANGKMSRSTIAAIIKRIKVHKTKKGEEMCFLTLEDESSQLENVVIFTDLYGQNKDIIYEDALVLISGEIKDPVRKSFIVESIFLI